MNKDLLNPIQNIIADRRSQALHWKSQGGKVVGYLSNNIPLELIEAAGMMPFHLNGDPAQGTELADEFMEPAFDPITRAIFNSLLKGEFDFVDLIVLPRSNDAQQRLYYYICEIHRKFPNYNLPPVFLVDLLHSPRATTEKHNILKFKEFLAFLESFVDSKISDESLRESIHSYNNIRAQLAEFNKFRAHENSSLSSLDAYYVYSAVQSLNATDFSLAMEKILIHLKTTGNSTEASEKTKRFVLAGNGLDHPGFHHAMDKLGATIVGDYHSFGNHFLVTQIDTEKSPIEAISEHYFRDTKSSRSFTLDPEEVVRFAKQQNATGILFHYLKKEEAITWQYPKQLSACKENGIKTLMLTDQEYQTTDNSNQELLQGFINSL